MVRVKTIWTRGYKAREIAERTLLSAGVDPSEGEWDYALGIYGWKGKFAVEDQRWLILQDKAIAAIGADPLIAELIDYTDEELAAAELLCLNHVRVLQRGDTGPDYGNEYDYSEACPLCLSGARLIPPFRIRERDLPKKRPVAQTHRLEVLVSGAVAAALCEIPGSDQWLVPVEDSASRGTLPWLAIYPQATMPRLHPLTRGIVHHVGPKPEDTCPQCGRDCHDTTYEEAMELVYSRAEIARACRRWIQPGESVPDAAATWELHGSGTRPGVDDRKEVAQPYLLLSQRVARVLCERVGNLVWLIPVTLLD